MIKKSTFFVDFFLQKLSVLLYNTDSNFIIPSNFFFLRFLLIN